jgi:hypothetical protein
MPALDKFHLIVKQALIRDGWTITDEPFYLQYEGTDVAIDFGAEKFIAAEKEGQRIAVEVKSFVTDSLLYEFHQVVGQCVDYQVMLDQIEPERVLYIAVPVNVYDIFFQRPFVQLVVQRIQMKLLVYDIQQGVITTWIK